DFLINDSVHLACWGEVNLKTHEGNFIAGIPLKTLQQFINLKDFDEDDYLQIPIHSKDGKIKINEKEILIKITTLLGNTQLEPKNKLLKKVFQQVAKYTKKESIEEKEMPKPTTLPFPWESL
ncbi:MAG: hypothetical protein Q8K60_08755, partial [Parachlamydiaceae bacterium]|nr:hypothetical protein [Parachlamydiaceae bacterium]